MRLIYMQLIDAQTKTVLLPNVETALTILSRFRGLMFRRKFCDGYGLWIRPCRSVHTMWMRVTIDVYFIDRQGVIVECRRDVGPWSFVIPKQKCHCVLEIPSGNTELQIGTRLQLIHATDEPDINEPNKG